MNRKLVGTATLGIILVASCYSRVSASPFTWDPAGASPPLSGAAFTADTIGINYYFRSVIQPDKTFAVHFLEPVTGFTLNGQPVAAPGLGSTYGLYFEMFVTGKNPPPLAPQYTSVQLALMADPGNQDGKPVPNANAINFSNTGPTGAADDITLATGSLVRASMFVEPGTGIRHAHYVTTFAAAPGEGGFFASGIDPSAVLDMLLMALPGNFNAPGRGRCRGSTGSPMPPASVRRWAWSVSYRSRFRSHCSAPAWLLSALFAAPEERRRRARRRLPEGVLPLLQGDSDRQRCDEAIARRK